MYLQHSLIVILLVPHETVAVSAHVLCRLHHAAMHRFTVTSFEACRVHECLTRICHPHFWQNDQDSLHPTTVTRVRGCKIIWNLLVNQASYLSNKNEAKRKATQRRSNNLLEGIRFCVVDVPSRSFGRLRDRVTGRI